MAELLTKGIEAIAVVARATLKDPKRDAPNVTLKQLNDAQCTVRRERGQFSMSLWRGKYSLKAPMHSGAWDKLVNNHDSLRRAFSFISPTFWTWNRGTTWLFNKTDNPVGIPSLAAMKLLCLRDMAFGAKHTCWSDEKTEGQLAAVEAVAKSKNPTVLRYMEAYFSMASKEPLEQFSMMELLVARNNPELLEELKELTVINTNEMKLEQAVSKLVRKVSVNAAAQLAAAAFNKVDLLVKSGTDCKSQVVLELMEAGNLWLKITRRLAHGMDAIRYQNSMKTEKKMQDPLFIARHGYSALECKAKDIPASVECATYFFNVQGTHAYFSGETLAFLMSTKTAAEGAMEKCVCEEGYKFFSGLKKCAIPNPCKKGWKLDAWNKCQKSKTGCKKNEVRNAAGECVCKDGYKFFRGLKKCAVPTRCNLRTHYRNNFNRCIKKGPGPMTMDPPVMTMDPPVMTMDPPVMRPMRPVIFFEGSE